MNIKGYLKNLNYSPLGVTELISGAALDFLFLEAGDILAHPLRPGEISIFV
jgi:hypothetical protein